MMSSFPNATSRVLEWYEKLSPQNQKIALAGGAISLLTAAKFAYSLYKNHQDSIGINSNRDTFSDTYLEARKKFLYNICQIYDNTIKTPFEKLSI